MSSGTEALRNLREIYDAGFITQTEFNSRRKTIIDSATAIVPAGGGGGAKKGAAGSVFARMGEPEEAADRPDRGGAAKRAKAGAGDLRSAIGKPAVKGIVKPTPGRTDLRAMMSKVAESTGYRSAGGKRGGGRGSDRGPGRGGRGMPEQCPW